MARAESGSFNTLEQDNFLLTCGKGIHGSVCLVDLQKEIYVQQAADVWETVIVSEVINPRTIFED
jgi:hypothetical protein